jgi:hypothetical protein
LRVQSRIYSACVRESLNELSYPAKQAGLNYSIREGYEGIFVDVNGYTESALKLVIWSNIDPYNFNADSVYPFTSTKMPSYPSLIE